MEVREPNEIFRCYGCEEIIVDLPDKNYCGKIFHLNKGFRFSYRNEKGKTFYILEGKVFFQLESGNGLDSKVLNARDIVDVPNGRWHSFNGLENSKILLISTHDENNINFLAEKIIDFKILEEEVKKYK